MRNKIIPYNPALKEKARALRKNSTLAEVLLWDKIKNKRLDVQFHRQVPIGNFIVDFYCHELLLVIEIDGSSHNLDGRIELDAQRQKILESFGIKFVRFQDIDVKRNPAGVIQMIETVIKERKQEAP